MVPVGGLIASRKSGSGGISARLGLILSLLLTFDLSPATCLSSAVIYQFIPVAPVRVMERLIRSMASGTMAVLDLEDGYLDVRDLVKTVKSKDHRMLNQGV
jgi:hypothetical protein